MLLNSLILKARRASKSALLGSNGLQIVKEGGRNKAAYEALAGASRAGRAQGRAPGSRKRSEAGSPPQRQGAEREPLSPGPGDRGGWGVSGLCSGPARPQFRLAAGGGAPGSAAPAGPGLRVTAARRPVPRAPASPPTLTAGRPPPDPRDGGGPRARRRSYLRAGGDGARRRRLPLGAAPAAGEGDGRTAGPREGDGD